MLLLLALLVAGAVALPRDSCVDLKNNIFTLADVNDASLSIHLESLVVAVYDKNGAPSCRKNFPSVQFPGSVKLVSGKIKVTAVNDLTKGVEGLLTLKKDSWTIGSVCDHGKSKNLLIPDKDCHASLDGLFPASLLQMLQTVGEYDIMTMGNFENIALPALSGTINGIVEGSWQVGIDVQVNGKTVTNIKAPGNEDWLYLA